MFVTVRDAVLPGWRSSLLAVDAEDGLPARGRSLFQELRLALERHVYFPEPWEYDVASLYVIQCWIGDTLPGFFYAFFDGTRGAGKTTVLDHISRLTLALRLQSFTLATLSRSMKKFRPVSIDEFDVVERSLEMGGAVAALVRQGYKRDAAPRKVCAPRSNEVLDLEIAGPKAITFRGTIDEALKDRGFRFPMARGTDYSMVVLGMAPEFGDLPNRLGKWAENIRSDWTAEKAAVRIKESSFGEKVRAVLGALEANRNSEIVTVAVLVAEVVGVDLTSSLRDAIEVKGRDEGVSPGVEELLDALQIVVNRTEPTLVDSDYIVVSPKAVRAEMDRARAELHLLPVKNRELARLRQDAQIADSWRVTIRGKDFWKVPKAFLLPKGAEESPLSAPSAPSRQDGGVPRVDRVPRIPTNATAERPRAPPASEAQVRAAARSAFDEATIEEKERR